MLDDEFLSLPTPPRARRSDKENQQSSSPVKKGIEWAKQEKRIHLFSPDSSSHAATTPSSFRARPAKSILKPLRPPLPFPFPKERDMTPMPSNPMANANYLEWPVSTILGESSTLRQLTEAYAVLASRIRESIPDDFCTIQSDTMHPLFHPLRKNARELAACIVRDLGRVFEDPIQLSAAPSLSPSPKKSRVKSLLRFGLSSPAESPSPKKGGMTEEQVKTARDLSTTTISVCKFLYVALQTSNIYSVFSESSLSDILDAILAIPNAETLRSSSARKIYGLAITVLQAQRLPNSILDAAKDRIVYAIRRALLGELGREGKKGAIGESLKTIHDLCNLQPLTFVPAFADILSCILDMLLNPSAGIRIQAVNALGGFALGYTSRPDLYSSLSEQVSSTVADFFLRKQPPIDGPQFTIQRTLHATLKVMEATHHALGPYWGLSVLASLIILLGPMLFTNLELVKELQDILKVGFSAEKSEVRLLAQTLWCPLVWVWRKYHKGIRSTPSNASEVSQATDCFERILVLPACQPIGVVLLCALMGRQDVDCPTEDVAFTLLTVRQAAKRGGESTQRSLDILDRLVNGTDVSRTYDKEWDYEFDSKLIVSDLFSTVPGILSTEMSELSRQIGRIFKKLPTLEDLRPFSDQEKSSTTLWVRTREIWYIMLEQVQLHAERDTLPETLLDIWAGILRSKVKSEEPEQSDRTAAAEFCAESLISILTNPRVDLRVETNSAKEPLGSFSASALCLKMKVIRVLWSTACSVLSSSTMRFAIKPMIRYLVSKFSVLVPTDDDSNTALSQWAELVAQVATEGSDDVARVLWTTEWEWDESTRAHVWRSFARGWTEDGKGSWKGAAILLGLPFENEHHWNMSDADLSEWSSLLQYAIQKADQANVGRVKVLDIVSSHLDHQHVTDLPSSMRVADFLLGSLNGSLDDAKALPISLLDFVHEVLLTSYPPEPRHKIIGLWTLRSLQRTVNNCPTALLVSMLEILHDGLSRWLADVFNVFSKDEHSRDIVTLYQTILVCLQSLPPSSSSLQDLSHLLLSALRRVENSEALSSFKDFWQMSCSSVSEPTEGWDESMKTCLYKAKILGDNEESASEEEVDELDVLPRSVPRSNRKLGPSPSKTFIFTRPSVSKPLPVTPKKSMIPTPTRRRRSMGLQLTVPHSPESPSRRKTRKSIAHVMEREDRFGVDIDKENVSPRVERMALALGKRKLSENYDANGKRRRTVAMPGSPSDDKTESDSDEDDEAVEAALQVSMDGSASPRPLILQSGISRLNIAKLGTQGHPIVLDPPSPPKRRRQSVSDAVSTRLRCAKLARHAHKLADPPSSDISEDSSSPMPATPVSLPRQRAGSCQIAGSDDSDETVLEESLSPFSPTRATHNARSMAHISRVMNMRPKAARRSTLAAPFMT